MTEDQIISRSSEAVSSGLSAILEVEGTLQPLKRVAGKKFDEESDAVPKDQIQVTLEDAVIREMEGTQPEPELKDDKFTTWITYAPPGQLEPSKQSKFNRVFVKSAEKLWADRGETDKGWRELVGERVVMRKQTMKWKIEGETIEGFCFGFVEGGDTVPDFDEYVAQLLEGEDKSTALRKFMQDNKVKRNLEIKEAIKAGQPVAGMELLEGVYCREETKKETSIASPPIKDEPF